MSLDPVNYDPYCSRLLPNIRISRLNSLISRLASAILILCPPLYLAERAAQWLTTKVIQHLYLPALIDKKPHSDKLSGLRPELMHEVKIKTSDGITLKGFTINRDDETDCTKQKWVVGFLGKGQSFPYSTFRSPLLALSYNVNYLFVNLRGVGESEGFPRSAEDLYRDGCAIVASLLNQGVEPKNILLHGYSLGGGIAASVTAQYHQDGKMIGCIHDRSFSSITTTVMSLIPKIPTVLQEILKDIEYSRSELIIPTLVTIAALIVTLIISPFLLLMIPFLAYKLSQLDMDAAAAMTHIDPKRFRVIYHKDDDVIPHPSSSHASYLQENYKDFDLCEIDNNFGKDLGANHLGNLLQTKKGLDFFRRAAQELLSLPIPEGQII